MTPERWRTADRILQDALVCSRDHRDEFVTKSCGDDSSLRNEVSSLLAVYDAMPAEFLERPAIEAVRQWKFEPGTRNGEKVAFKMRVPITFTAS